MRHLSHPCADQPPRRLGVLRGSASLRRSAGSDEPVAALGLGVLRGSASLRRFAGRCGPGGDAGLGVLRGSASLRRRVVLGELGQLARLGVLRGSASLRHRGQERHHRRQAPSRSPSRLRLIAAPTSPRRERRGRAVSESFAAPPHCGPSVNGKLVSCTRSLGVLRGSASLRRGSGRLTGRPSRVSESFAAPPHCGEALVPNAAQFHQVSESFAAPPHCGVEGRDVRFGFDQRLGVLRGSASLRRDGAYPGPVQGERLGVLRGSASLRRAGVGAPPPRRTGSRSPSRLRLIAASADTRCW